METAAWNTISYAAFIAIIIGVYRERSRNTLITLGAVALALYAGLFLHNYLFAALQTLIVISGVMQLAKVSRSKEILLALTVLTFAFLIWGGVISAMYGRLSVLSGFSASPSAS